MEKETEREREMEGKRETETETKRMSSERKGGKIKREMKEEEITNKNYKTTNNIFSLPWTIVHGKKGKFGQI